jgi:hypothetical protein
MLDLGLVKTFRDLKSHPSDDYIISKHNISPEKYKEMVRNHYAV